MPREASPHARSRNGLLGPKLSSRLCGPHPCTSTTAQHGSSFAGRVSVPGRAHCPAPTVTSFSRNKAGIEIERSAAVGDAFGFGCCACNGALQRRETHSRRIIGRFMLDASGIRPPRSGPPAGGEPCGHTQRLK